ncbi:hypothetical protein ACFFWC_21475 [Plantactinospora siamensis]|uniref:Uncharacterized protein n=1 Tax=Plantactinospora siamensis TaxID=555372 RepID=A0ABV6P7R2_9ACTN
MPHPDEPTLVAYVAEHSSATALAVYDATDPAAAFAALRAAAGEISQIRHPDEPHSGLPNWCAVLDEDGVPVLRLDMKDEIRYSALVVRIVLDRLAAGGVDGRLAPKRPPESPFRYDPNADRYSGMEPLTQLDERGLPPGFPAGFPVPEQATLVLAQRGRDGVAEHAAWRRSTGAFPGYLDRLRAFGCTFGPVPRLLTARDHGTVRYTLWRDGAGGSVTLYQSAAARRPGSTLYWYVSVVWQQRAEPPATAVEPDEAPDMRPIPTGPAAAREVAEFLAPAPLVAGYETVMALATAARAIDGLVSAPPDPADRRPRPAVIAGRLTHLLGRLDREQLSTVRHVCLTMVTNILATGRRPRPRGLRLVADENGHLYAADLRDGVREAVSSEDLPAFEAGTAVAQSAPMIIEGLSGLRDAPVPPPADRYAWLFAGLSPQHLAATRDACWRILTPT